MRIESSLVRLALSVLGLIYAGAASAASAAEEAQLVESINLYRAEVRLMTPRFSELGVAFAVDLQRDGGIYWTALFRTL
ncbi:hypothetical protein [Stutzerimonas stutzeri]|uniref:hypothetical protein n=1 Tax=Stutzerimonas stutzeri TaxID=316 RepID=UPI003C6F501A